MKKTREASLGVWLLAGVMTLALIMLLALFTERFSIVSHAESQATVTASTANIRKEPNPGSEVIGSTEKDKVISIRSQTTGSDGNIWYQVFVNSTTLGYLRSDLVSITDGTTPPTEDAGTTITATTPNTTTPTQAPVAAETPVEVTAVNPISATVTGGQKVRVRANASTTSQVVTTAQDGLALTVTGQANGTDANTWYQVTFIANGAEVTGFIRSDYVALSGELTPVTGDNPEEGTTGDPLPEDTDPVPQETKDWETQLQGEEWYLINNVEAKQYLIQDLFDAGIKNAELYTESEKKVKNQKTLIVLLVIFLVLLSAAVAFLIFKIKDMTDSAYFSEVEKETIRRKDDRVPGGPGQKVMHTVGGAKQGGAGSAGARPAGARAAGGGAPIQGGPKSAGTRPGGARPAGDGAPVQGGTKPAGARTTGPKTAGGGAPAQGGTKPAGVRPPGPRPAGGGVPGQSGTRPAGARTAPGGASAQGGPKPADPRVAAPKQQTEQNQNPGWKSKNFMTDEDEFEFEFLNWDGEEDQ